MDLNKAIRLLKEANAKMFKSDFATALNVVLTELDNRKRDIEIKDSYFDMISVIGYDYDGLEFPKDLKNLIDEMVKYAHFGLESNDEEVMFISGRNFEEKFNILHERLGKNNEK